MEPIAVPIVLCILVLIIAAAVFLFVLPRNVVPDEIITLDGKDYKLTFYDDFDGKKLNQKNWSLCPEQKRGDIGGRWKDEMTELDGKGNLTLKAGLEERGGKTVPISGGIRSKWKFEQCEGYYEIRCKLQSASGFWSAFWLMCDAEHRVGNGASDGAEIDIFEAFDVKGGAINHAIHWDGYKENHRWISEAIAHPECYDGEYHIFSLLWNNDGYFFYVDGKESFRIAANAENYPGNCRKKTYLKITTEFGTWAKQYHREELPDCLIVDYVKVYQAT